MQVTSLKATIETLASIPDQSIQSDIKQYGLKVTDTKYRLAFSAYGATKLLATLDVKTFSGGTPTPSEALSTIQYESTLVLRAYVALVYMRSETLERELDHIPDTAFIYPYKNLLRTGTKKDKSDTLAQHLRNSLCHGSFEVRSNGYTQFTDQKWQATISNSEFLDLCHQIFRFYREAYPSLPM